MTGQKKTLFQLADLLCSFCCFRQYAYEIRDIIPGEKPGFRILNLTSGEWDAGPGPAHRKGVLAVTDEA
jgi:hypothetical protein